MIDIRRGDTLRAAVRGFVLDQLITDMQGWTVTASVRFGVCPPVEFECHWSAEEAAAICELSAEKTAALNYGPHEFRARITDSSGVAVSSTPLTINFVD